MNICLFTPEEFGKPLSLKDERGAHLIKILHKTEGSTFTAGIAGGKAGTAVITKITDRNIEYTFTPESEGKPLYPLTMIIGFPRPIQLKRLLRDIAGIGACTVHLTGTELGEKSYMQSELVKSGAAYKMLLDGTVQAAGTHIPELFLHQTLSECLNAADKLQNEDLRLALDNVNPQHSLMGALADAKVKNDGTFPARITAAIGSERGWTDRERSMLERAGFTRCGLGPRILRTETAATAAAAIIAAAAGWME